MALTIWLPRSYSPGPLALLAAAIAQFACNSAAMSTIIGLTEEKPIVESMDGELSLVVSLLSGWGSTCRSGEFPERARGMAIVAPGAASDLSDVPLLPAVPGQTGSGEAACRKGFESAPADDRSAGAGH